MACRWAGAAAIGLVVLLWGAIARADDVGDKTVGARLREKFPPLDQDKFKDMAIAANKRTAEELAEDKFFLDRAHDVLMKKWKVIQETREAHRKLTQGAAFITGAHTLNLLGLETERKEKVQAVVDRENAEFQRRFRSKARTEEEIRFAVYEWEQTPEYRAYQEEREAVRTWFKDAVQQEARRAQTGQSKLMDALDEMTAEAHDEAAFLARARRLVDREIEKRKAGVGPERSEQEEKEEAEKAKDAIRASLHFAPVRTEYEGKTGETVETLFQVWNGRTPYLVYSYSKGSTQSRLDYLHVPESGDFSVLFTFQKPGAYTGVVHATDQNGSDVKATVTITVTGDPVTPKRVGPKGGDEPPPGMGDPPAQPQGTTPIPLNGTFHALLFAGADPVPRQDAVPDGMVVTPVPVEITIDGAGKIRGKADYALPASQAGKPRKDGGKNLYWKSSFRLEGQVDWTTGRTHLDMLDGVAESGGEADTPGYGLWQESFRAEYTGTLDGWSIPSPAGDRWMGAAGMQAGGKPLEYTGRPEFVTGPDGKRAFQGRGFFGDNRGAGVPGVQTAWAKTPSKFVHRSGYAGKPPDIEDSTKYMGVYWTLAARLGFTGWYLKLVDAPPPADPEPPKEEEPKKGELWAFGLWPIRPIQTRVGGKATARAMGVFSDDPFEATDLSAKATWSSNRPGLVVNERGEITASAPGVYHVTATFTGPDGQPMSSTLTVAVSKE